MKWKQRGWFLAVVVGIIVLETIPVSCRKQRRPPVKETRRQEGSDLRRLTTVRKEQARLLRRLILESSQLFKRGPYIGRQRWAGNDNENDAWQGRDNYDDEYETGGQQYTSINSSPTRKSKDLKRIDEMIDEPKLPKLCCPHKYEIIEPNFGRNRTGHIVNLYQDDRIQQQFYELICDQQIVNQPCRFLQGRNYKWSRCTQQHSLTYALVQSNQSLSGWTLDHIRIRSGCACKLYQPLHTKKKKNSRWDELK